MTTRPFGWDLPPGVTNRMIDEHFGDDECCDECTGDGVSSCCGIYFDGDYEICPACKEHCDSAGCGDESCTCHWTKDDWKEAKGEAKYEAQREDRI